MEKRCMIWAGIHGFFAVAMGAFAAHLLKQRLEAPNLEWIETGARYQMYHALALLALGAWSRNMAKDQARRLSWSASGFAWGTLIFTGSLDAMALGGSSVLGALTPVGGLWMLAGWANLAIFSSRYL
jgi:uncharacterized membrane protein YgdD (TMEM256/DUF423 family)